MTPYDIVLLLTRDRVLDFSFWLDHTFSLLQFVLHRGEFDAIDTGHASVLRQEVKAGCNTPLNVSLFDLGIVLDECGSYGLLGVISWFVTSRIEEIWWMCLELVTQQVQPVFQCVWPESRVLGFGQA
ncbi:uncharacterized protein EI90DRAFT_3289199 [Cantharellus anzutake]|uniref:uncharacterized protein n=1 Tax=Cantharellus anzutake TaxID=1750568 RepID=UPI001902D57E|nr:uncharacterized protein EI90DRAFT_3289199 [Cantharellus anzutake]KAF8331965.1 hypothetical protein EI90DRAFT_3289199 [Cantharellus anzutake]